LAYFSIFCLASLTANPPAKFDVCGFILTRDNRGVPKFKRKSRDLGRIKFSPNFIYFLVVLVFPTLSPPAKFEVCSFFLTRDNRGPKIQ